MLQNRKSRFDRALEMLPATGSTPGAAGPGAPRVGAELRAARQRLGWVLPDVAAALRIRLPFLNAIEEGRLADMPGTAYAMGFIRSYSSFLGLDPAEVVRRFRAEASDVNDQPDLTFPAPVPDRGVPAGAVVLLSVLIAAGSYAAWYKSSGDTPGVVPVPIVPERLAPLAEPVPLLPTSSAQVASGMPAASPPSNPAPVPLPLPPAPATVPVPVAAPPQEPPADKARMVLRLKSDSWIHVRAKQGPVLVNRIMHTGETWPVPKGQLLLTTGNAGGTEVLVEGVALPALGASGAVRRDVPLDPDDTKPGTATLPAATPALAPGSGPTQ